MTNEGRNAVKKKESYSMLGLLSVGVFVISFCHLFFSGDEKGGDAGFDRLQPVSPSIASLVSIVGNSFQSHEFQQFRLSQTPLELSRALFTLSTALYDIVARYEHEEASFIAARKDLSELVLSVEVLSSFAACGPAAFGSEKKKCDGLLFAERTAVDVPSYALWNVASSAVFAHAVALPDYYQCIDRDEDALRWLSSAVNTLEWISSENGGAGAVDFMKAGQDGSFTTPHDALRMFVTSSLISPAHAKRRRAAILEEMIAHLPAYAPLRLYYATAVVFGMERAAESSSRDFITRELQQFEKRVAPDAAHKDLLTVMLGYVTSQQKPLLVSAPDTRALLSQVAAALLSLTQGKVSEGPRLCLSALTDPISVSEKSSWRGRLKGDRPVALMTISDARKILNALREPLERFLQDKGAVAAIQEARGTAATEGGDVGDALSALLLSCSAS